MYNSCISGLFGSILIKKRKLRGIKNWNFLIKNSFKKKDICKRSVFISFREINKK